MAVPHFMMLHSGSKMPSLGLGTFMAQGGLLQEAVDCALDVGYKHIDTAFSYQNHTDIAEMLNQKLTKGNIKRKDLFITTKVPPVYLDKNGILQCVEKSLDELKVKDVDMILIHSPWGLRNRQDGNLKPLKETGDLDFYSHDLRETWTVFESLVKRGWTKNIGVSNFSLNQLDYIFSAAKIKPSNLQLECHVYLQQNELCKYCKNKGIVVTAYSPLGAPGRPNHQTEINDPELLKNQQVLEIAKSMNKSPSQILIRFLMQLSIVPLPKSTSTSRIEENYKVWDFTINENIIKQLISINKNHKYFRFPQYQNHPYFPQKGEPY